ENREIPGLAAIESIIVTPDGKELFPMLLAFVMKEGHSEAVQAALKGDIEGVREHISDSAIFDLPPKLEVPPETPQAKPMLQPTPTQLGHISMFNPERGYGFIIDLEENAFFFHINQLEDSVLRKELYFNETGQKISFIKARERTPGTKYDVAEYIRLIETPEKGKETSLAVNQALMSARLAALPKDNSTYANAKRAEVFGDLDKAEDLFQQVILESHSGKYYHSAVMDLAHLLSRLGRDNEAIALLDTHRHEFVSTQALDRQKINYLAKMKRYQEASVITQDLQKRAIGYEKVKFARLEAYYVFMAGDKQNALKILETIQKSHSRDAGTLQMIAMVKRALKSGKG